MDVLVRHSDTMYIYNCYDLEHGVVRIGVPGARGHNQSFLVAYGLDDSLEQGDWFRLAILTHATDPHKRYRPQDFHPVSEAAKAFCCAKDKQLDVTKDVLGFLCLAKLQRDNSVSRLSILCSTPGSMVQIDRALQVLCESGPHIRAPVERIDQLPVKPGDEPSYSLPSLWEALRALERLKAL